MLARYRPPVHVRKTDTGVGRMPWLVAGVVGVRAAARATAKVGVFVSMRTGNGSIPAAGLPIAPIFRPPIAGVQVLIRCVIVWVVAMRVVAMRVVAMR